MQEKIKLLTIVMLVLTGICIMTGCAKTKDGSFLKQKSVKNVYFHKGVYKSYSFDKQIPQKGYFYIFYDETSGYTEEAEMGIGLPFSCEQTEDSVKFKFGGAYEPEEIFKIKSIKNNIMSGSFKDGILLEFIPVPNADPDQFDAIEYMKKEN